MRIRRLPHLPTTRLPELPQRHPQSLNVYLSVGRDAWDATRTTAQTAPDMTVTLSDADFTTPSPCTGLVPLARWITTRERRAIHGQAEAADLRRISSGQMVTTPPCHLGRPTELNNPLEAVSHLPPKVAGANTRDHLVHLRPTIQQLTSAVLRPRAVRLLRPLARALPPAQVQYHVPRSLILNPSFDEADVKHKQTTMQERGDSYQLASAQDQDPLDCLTGPASTSRPA